MPSAFNSISLHKATDVLERNLPYTILRPVSNSRTKLLQTVQAPKQGKEDLFF
jgi:hypothetical protein